MKSNEAGKKKGNKAPKSAQQPPKRGGAGPIVAGKKDAVSKGASPARRARGDHPR